MDQKKITLGPSQRFELPDRVYMYEPVLVPPSAYLGTVYFNLPNNNPGNVNINLIMHEGILTDGGSITTAGNNATKRTLNLPHY